MRKILRKLAMLIAPTAYGKLQRFDPDKPTPASVDITEDLLARIADLEVQIREIRQDNRRVVELYDAVFERLRQDNPLIQK
ncbi:MULTISPECIES: hypothetical protein [Microbacterium]|jgi:chromosome segregation ATPase|uniref:hypothetical protein n=1 Tax=Microbacterium TaxID=33882 RepID=UPI0012CF0228|nr:MULTISPECIES: hypothetical protein [Microbacterium]MPT15154.1 hypothetical protein [Microbacterium sp.]